MGFKRIIKLYYFRIKYITKKVTIKKGCNIASFSMLCGCNIIGENCTFAGQLGYGSYIGKDSIICGLVGKYCSIASGVKILEGTHPLDFISTSPVFYSLLKQNNITFVTKQQFDEFLYADKINKYPVIIGNDVWIGTNSIINGGITIGDGAVILPGAIVTKNVPSYAIVGGNPAQILRYRFDDETILYLLKTKWWDQSTEWLRKNVHFFKNINLFKEKYRNE